MMKAAPSFPLTFGFNSVRRGRLVRVVAAGRDGRAVAAVAELSLGVVEAVKVEAVGVEVRDEVVGVAQEDDGLVARLGAYFEQALHYLKGGEYSHRVSVCRHLFPPPYTWPAGL